MRNLRHSVATREDEDRYSYASALVESTREQRVEFFEALETLVDRHTAQLVRIKALQIFLEFGAIEGSQQGDVPLGISALASLGNVITSNIQLDRIFVNECVIDPLTTIIKNMSTNYLMLAVGEILKWVRATHYPDELANNLAECAKSFAKLHQFALIRAQVFWDRNVESHDEWIKDPYNLCFSRVSEIITFTCRSSMTAAKYVPELPMVMYTRLPSFKKLKPSSINNGSVFSPYRLLASIADAVPAAAHFFVGPPWSEAEVKPATISFYNQLKVSLSMDKMMEFLLDRCCSFIWEEQDSESVQSASAAAAAVATASQGNLVIAHLLTLLFSILKNSNVGLSLFHDHYTRTHRNHVNRSMTTGGDLAPPLLQLARRALRLAQQQGANAQPAAVHALLRGILVLLRFDPVTKTFSNHPVLQQLREELENTPGHFVSFVKCIQETSKQLLAQSASNMHEAVPAELQGSMVCLLDIMRIYNDTPFSQYFNEDHCKTYDREAIVFHVLADATSTQVAIDDRVRLAAARCLSTLKLEEFSQNEIQRLVQIFSSIPNVIPASRYEVFCQLQHFMFRLALHEHASPTDSNTPGGAGRDRRIAASATNMPGQLFRSLYAPEVSAAVFGLLERLILESNAENTSNWEVRFMKACVKFLMTGWVKYEFHADKLGQRPVDILALVIQKEQQRIQELGQQFEQRKQRYHRLIEEQRCVVSEEDLTLTPEYAEKSYRLAPIRLKKYAGVKLSQLTYHHTYLEQTSIGARVKNLFPVIQGLQTIDIIAFRAIHQLANVIEGVTFVNSVNKMRHMTFEQWDMMDVGNQVTACELSERRFFDGALADGLGNDEASQNERNRAAEATASAATRGDSELVRVIPLTVTQLSSEMNKFKAMTERHQEICAQVQTHVDKLEDPLAVVLGAYLPIPSGFRFVAGVIAGPDKARMEAVQQAVTEGRAKPEELGEAYISARIHMCFWVPDLGPELTLVQRELLARTSNALWKLGFKVCRFRAGERERTLLSEYAAQIEDAPDQDTAAAAAESPKTSTPKDSPKSGASVTSPTGTGRGKKHQEVFISYRFNLAENIFRMNQEHKFFMQHDVITKLVQLILKTNRENQIEEQKQQGKVNFSKLSVKRYHPMIRVKIDEFAGQLTSRIEEEHRRGAAAGQSNVVTLNPAIANSLTGVLPYDCTLPTANDALRTAHGLSRFEAQQAMRFREILDTEFKSGSSLCMRAQPALWEKILAGSREETMIEAMSRTPVLAATVPKPAVAAALLSQLPPDMNPRTNPDDWPAIWLTEELERQLLASQATTSKDSKEVSAKSADQRELELEIRERRFDLELAQKRRAEDREEIVRRQREWDLPPLLQTYTVPATAAVLRMMYYILTRSQRESFNTLTKSLMTFPLNELGPLEGLRAVLAACQYQLRGSVLEQYPQSSYGIAIKALGVLEASFTDVPPGLDDVMAAFEYYEVTLEIMKDIARLLVSLLESRNTSYTAAAAQGAAKLPTEDLSGAPNPLLSGDLVTEEEHAMEALCKGLLCVMRQIHRLCLFSGRSRDVIFGNQLLRRHAEQQLLTQQSIFVDFLQAVLLYDLEKEHELGAFSRGPLPGSSADPRTQSNPVYRDTMRTYAAELLGYFTHADDNFRYKFLNEFCVSSIKAERSIRASVIQRVLNVNAMLRFRERLEAVLQERVFDLGEFLCSCHFVEHSISDPIDRQVDFPGVRLFVISNKRYYISKNLFNWNIETEILGYLDSSMAQFAQLTRYEFTDVLRLYRDISGQAFAIRCFSQPALQRLKTGDVTRETHCFLNRNQGVAAELLTELAKRLRDDANRVHVVAADEFTMEAVTTLSRVCDAKLRHTSPLMVTYVRTVKRDASVEPRLLIWTRTRGSETDITNQYIIVTSHSLKSWRPHVGRESDQEIHPAQSWTPQLQATPQPNGPAPENSPAQNEESRHAAAFFNIESETALPKVLNTVIKAMPDLPIASFGPTPAFSFSLAEVQSIDFMEEAETDMVIRLRRTESEHIPSLYIRFADDTAREMWRRKFKQFFFSGQNGGQWIQSVIPDLSDASRRKQEFL